MRDAGVFQSTTVPRGLEDRLKAMPKVEIHVHLEGATGPETVWDMAARNRVALPADSLDAWRRIYDFRDFAHFIEVYELATSTMQTREDYEQMVVDFAARQAAQGILYSEAYFSPQLHLGRGLSRRDILASLGAGAEQGHRIHGTTVRFIADLSRQTRERRTEVLRFALDGRERGGLFIGMGVGGIETGYPTELFTTLFDEARRNGLHVVAHAGETEGPESVWGALRDLGAQRIGHGVRSTEDRALVDHLRQKQIPLEVSPNSNYRLHVTPSDRPHPARALVDAGVYVTLNSDDPPMFSTDLNNEYVTLAGQGFSWQELWRLNRNTLDATFLLDGEKASLRRRWDRFEAELPEL